MAGLEDFWQLHGSANPKAHQADDPFIANLDVRTAHSITPSALDDGSLSITNMGTGVVKHYDAK